MISNWKEKPCRIEEIPGDHGIKYIMALDESGTSTLKNLQDNQLNNWFTVTASVLHVDDFHQTSGDITKLKEKYWENGMYNDKRVVFHSREIRKKVGAFNPKIIDHNDFISDLGDLLTDIPSDIYSASINKKKLIRRYYTPMDPYDLSMQFILERFNFKLRRERVNGLIFLESRGNKEDKELHKKICNLLDEGNNYQDAGSFQHIKGVFYNPKRTQDFRKSYWQLELADLFCYPIHKYVRDGKKSDSFKSFEQKIHGYPSYQGKGLKMFPL